MSVRVQFIISDEEYEDLKKRAENEGKGVSISKYVKDKVFDRENSFESVWEEFLQKINSFPEKVEFNVANAMTIQRWNELDRSTKLSLAKQFNKRVLNGDLPEIKLVGRSPTNVSIYMKEK